MKKLFALLTVFVMLAFGAANYLVAQEAETQEAADTTQVEQPVEEAAAPAPATQEPEESQALHKTIKRIFIEGGAEFMGVILLALIFGLAIAIERILYLNFATTNTEKLLKNVEDALEKGGIEAAKNICRDTRGPVASIFYQGISKYDEGIDVVEKSVVAYGGVQTGLLEKNLTWIALFISLAPMLGFLGTVIGMIAAFDAIEVAGDISPSLVAGGIKIALITTVFGLIVAIILQVFYNYLTSKIDSLVNTMEDASISLIDILVKYNLKK